MPHLPRRLARVAAQFGCPIFGAFFAPKVGIARIARPLPPITKPHPSLMRIFGLVFLAASTLAAAAAPGVLGDWRSTTGSIVRIYPCGSDVCLRVVKLSPDAPTSTDQQNPDSSLRSRPLCNLTIGTGFHQSDPTHLTGGHLYDPKSGHTYRGTIAAEGDTLKLHGYISISLFGRTETWQRAPTIQPCH